MTKTAAGVLAYTKPNMVKNATPHPPKISHSEVKDLLGVKRTTLNYLIKNNNGPKPAMIRKGLFQNTYYVKKEMLAWIKQIKEDGVQYPTIK